MSRKRLKQLTGSHAGFEVNENESFGKKLHMIRAVKKRYVNEYSSGPRFGVPTSEKLCQFSRLKAVLDQKSRAAFSRMRGAM